MVKKLQPTGDSSDNLKMTKGLRNNGGFTRQDGDRYVSPNGKLATL